jgi:hypothetical protein
VVLRFPLFQFSSTEQKDGRKGLVRNKEAISNPTLTLHQRTSQLGWRLFGMVWFINFVIVLKSVIKVAATVMSQHDGLAYTSTEQHELLASFRLVSEKRSWCCQHYDRRPAFSLVNHCQHTLGETPAARPQFDHAYRVEWNSYLLLPSSAKSIWHPRIDPWFPWTAIDMNCQLYTFRLGDVRQGQSFYSTRIRPNCWMGVLERRKCYRVSKKHCVHRYNFVYPDAILLLSYRAQSSSDLRR